MLKVRADAVEESTMEHWYYVVNDRKPEQWGYELSVSKFFEHPVDDYWHVKRKYAIHDGDSIWVYAASPHRKIVGVGIMRGELERDDAQFRFWIEWDREACARLVDGNVRPSLVTQGPRRLQPDEIERLLAAVPGGKVRATAPALRFASVQQRQGQSQFREALMKAYRGACAVTGCEEPGVLQAAHIDAWSESRDNDVTNGLLLRADIHNLFDLGLLWIDKAMQIRVADDVRAPEYRALDGQRLRPPRVPSAHPSQKALGKHRMKFAR